MYIYVPLSETNLRPCLNQCRVTCFSFQFTLQLGVDVLDICLSSFSLNFGRMFMTLKSFSACNQHLDPQRHCGWESWQVYVSHISEPRWTKVRGRPCRRKCPSENFRMLWDDEVLEQNVFLHFELIHFIFLKSHHPKKISTSSPRGSEVIQGQSFIRYFSTESPYYVIPNKLSLVKMLYLFLMESLNNFVYNFCCYVLTVFEMKP